MSGGQQQRLCIARALAVNPEVILMDEPTSALDPISTSKIEDLVIELKKQYTIVMVTHNMQQAVRVSDKTVFFLLGEVIEAGETEKLFSIPIACDSFKMPEFTKPTTMTVVAEDDWITAVTPAPSNTALNGFVVRLSKIRSNFPPDIFSRPPPITLIPYRNIGAYLREPDLESV